MQESMIGSWAQESRLTGEIHLSLRNLNHQFLDLMSARDRVRTHDWIDPQPRAAAEEIAEYLAPLSARQRSLAADCPYALFDLRFQDSAHWSRRLKVADICASAEECSMSAETVNFARLALFFAWHVTTRTPLNARLVLGMSETTVDAFRALTVNGLVALAATESCQLTARWSASQGYWRALLGGALHQEGPALRRAQLFGLQLAAAAQLPPGFREGDSHCGRSPLKFTLRGCDASPSPTPTYKNLQKRRQSVKRH